MRAMHRKLAGTGTRRKAQPVVGTVFGSAEDAEFGRIVRTGAEIGIPLTFAAAALIMLAVGVGVQTAIVAAIWPAIVGGPFFGVLFTQSRRLVQVERGEAPSPARPRHKHRHKPRLAG